MKIILNLFVALVSAYSYAQLDLKQRRGSENYYFETPQRTQETCFIPEHIDFGTYKKKDLEVEKELCSYDFHGLTTNREVKQMAMCPKLKSTNPGVLVMEIPEGWNRSQFESQKCLGKKNPLQKTKAKFKQSVTCSYTPSILAYYHFSRLLSGAGRVPVAVLRTISKNRHFEVTRKGQEGTKKIGGAIYKGWSILVDSHSKQNAPPLLFDSSGQFVFGAIQRNIEEEAVYYEITGGGDYDDRYDNFIKKDFYKKLKSPQAILEILGSNQFEKVAQPISTLKDASDMILLDTLLTQQDRMYNQHFKWAWMWLENGEFNRKRVDAQMDEENEKLIFKTAEQQAQRQIYLSKGAVLVKEMILKDNDCGVRANFYSNRMKDIKAFEGIRHMSGETYQAFMKLAKNLNSTEMISFLKNEILMSDADIKLLNKNFAYVMNILQTKCRKNELRLDLDLENYFSAKPETFQCEL